MQRCAARGEKQPLKVINAALYSMKKDGHAQGGRRPGRAPSREGVARGGGILLAPLNAAVPVCGCVGWGGGSSFPECTLRAPGRSVIGTFIGFRYLGAVFRSFPGFSTHRSRLAWGCSRGGGLWATKALWGGGCRSPGGAQLTLSETEGGKVVRWQLAAAAPGTGPDVCRFRTFPCWLGGSQFSP